MDITQKECVDTAIKVSGLDDTDRNYLALAGDQLAEWREDVVEEILEFLRENKDFVRHFSDRGIDWIQMKAQATDWYDKLTSGVYDDYYWDDICSLGLQAQLFGTPLHHTIGISHRVGGALENRIFEVYQEASAVNISRALWRLISSTIAVMSETSRTELISCVEKLGIRKTILDRMVNLETTPKIKFH